MLRRTWSNIWFVVIALGLAIGTQPLHGETVSFFRHFTAPGMDRAIAATADESGIYVIGNKPGFPGGQNSSGLRKYDSRGNELWTREFSVPAFEHVKLINAAAGGGGVYVLGYGGAASRLVLSKYSVDGNHLWTRQLEFFPPGDIAVDASGVYVAGRDFPPNATYLRKYTPDGDEMWTNRWGDQNNLDNPHSVTVDSTGVYVFGIAGRYGSNTVTSFTFGRKFDPRGNELWNRQMDPFPGSPSRFAAASPSGFYLVSASAGARSLRKYDDAGNEQWNRQTNGATAVAADATGVYIAGTTESALPGQCRSGSGGDSFVSKYDPDGAEMWTRQFGTSDAAWASGLAVDSNGVYAVGQEGTSQVRDNLEVFEAFAAVNPTSSAFLVKFEKSAAVATAGPRIFPDCIVNSASLVGGGVAPGETVSIFGAEMGPSELVAQRITEDQRLATTLSETRILFDGVPAPLMYVSDKQSSAIVPYSVADRTSVEVQVEFRGVRSGAVSVPVLSSRPGIYSRDGSGKGQGEILNEDGSLNSPSNPAVRGSIVTLVATGGGEASPGVVDGQILSDVLPETSLPVSVIFDLDYSLVSQPGEVLYAGGVSGSLAGVLNIRVRTPANAVVTGPEVPFLLIIGSQWTVYQVTIALQ